MSDWLPHWRVPDGAYDELLDADGNVRAHWEPLISGLANLGPQERQHAQSHSRTLLEDNDVTYQPLGAGAATRPWQLDLMPFVLAPDEFRRLQAGLSQRARLLDAIVADCLGPQTLMAGGHLPPGLVFSHNGFFPACHDAGPPTGRYLYLAGFDIARAPSGQWWVVRNRVSMPSGLGYALEARIISSQCLPELFEQASARRVSRFFRTFSDSLHGLAGKENPLSLVLTTRKRGVDYFEHAFLGRYLGQGVVTGGDLTVRDNRVYLKTIRGLRPVDLLLRRVETGNCDPQELRFDAQDGVPGLMQAVRHGQVAIANWPGAEIADNPALNSFLPSLCEQLLGEPLMLPSVASWWCGQPRELQYVLDNLDHLVVRRLETAGMANGSRHSQFVGAQLDAGQRRELTALIRQFPAQFVGQEPMTVSVAPSWNAEGRIVPASTSLRLYLTAANGEPDFQLMPGGLARADTRNAHEREPMRLPNDLNKDIWVGTDSSPDSVPAASMLPTTIALQRSDRNLSSRTADNLFWLGSYMERAESATRLFRTLIQHISGEASLGQPVAALDKLGAVLVSQGQLSARRARRLLAQGKRSFAFGLSSIIFDPDSADSLTQILGNIARIADSVRERLSPDMWRLLERLTQMPAHWTRDPVRDPLDALNRLNSMVDSMAAVNGMIALNMTRADGWRFLESGRRLERLRQMSRLFRELTLRPASFEQGSLHLLLELSDCAITYRSRYGAAPQFAPVVDLILADDTHPRSMLTQVVALRHLIDDLPELDNGGVPDTLDKTLLRLESSLRLIEPAQLEITRTPNGARTGVARLCQRVENDAASITVYLNTHLLQPRDAEPGVGTVERLMTAQQTTTASAVYRVQHRTGFDYSADVSLSQQLLL
ncbi:MAG: circularly permuted type 2 ATP-grasp protein [Burkholderiaceae bacterium]